MRKGKCAGFRQISYKKKSYFLCPAGKSEKQIRNWGKVPFLSISHKAWGGGGGYYVTPCNDQKTKHDITFLVNFTFPPRAHFRFIRRMQVVWVWGITTNTILLQEIKKTPRKQKENLRISKKFSDRVKRFEFEDGKGEGNQVNKNGTGQNRIHSVLSKMPKKKMEKNWSILSSVFN